MFHVISSSNNAKYLKFYGRKVYKSLQEIATLAIIREISDSNLETGRYGPKSGVSRIIRQSWQHCGFRILCQGGTWIRIPVVSGIADSLSCIPDSKRHDHDGSRFQKRNFPDSGFDKKTCPGIRIPLHGAKQCVAVHECVTYQYTKSHFRRIHPYRRINKTLRCCNMTHWHDMCGRC